MGIGLGLFGIGVADSMRATKDGLVKMVGSCANILEFGFSVRPVVITLEYYHHKIKVLCIISVTRGVGVG